MQAKTISPKVGSNIISLTSTDNGIVIAGDYVNGNIYRSVPTKVCD
jgi:hypothetical protein